MSLVVCGVKERSRHVWLINVYVIVKFPRVAHDGFLSDIVAWWTRDTVHYPSGGVAQLEYRKCIHINIHIQHTRAQMLVQRRFMLTTRTAQYATVVLGWINTNAQLSCRIWLVPTYQANEMHRHRPHAEQTPKRKLCGRFLFRLFVGSPAKSSCWCGEAKVWKNNQFV